MYDFRRGTKILLLDTGMFGSCPAQNPPLFEPSQFGFCSQHSIETALLKLQDNIPLSTDSGLRQDPHPAQPYCSLRHK